MEPLITYLTTQWQVIAQAPAVFAIAVCLCVAVAWTAISWAYSTRFDAQASSITSLESRLKLKEDQVSDYKDKLKGASPEEARARLDSLEEQIKSVRSELDELSKIDLANKFEEMLGTVEFKFDGGKF